MLPLGVSNTREGHILRLALNFSPSPPRKRTISLPWTPHTSSPGAGEEARPDHGGVTGGQHPEYGVLGGVVAVERVVVGEIDVAALGLEYPGHAAVVGEGVGDAPESVAAGVDGYAVDRGHPEPPPAVEVQGVDLVVLQPDLVVVAEVLAEIVGIVFVEPQKVPSQMQPSASWAMQFTFLLDIEEETVNSSCRPDSVSGRWPVGRSRRRTISEGRMSFSLFLFLRRYK